MVNSLVGQFSAAMAAMYGAILPIAQNLFILLAAISITWSVIWWVIEKDDPVPIFVSLLKNLMRISFFWFILLNAQSLAQTIFQSFQAAGIAAASAAGSPISSLDPTAIIATGSALADQLMSNLSFSGVISTFLGAFAASILSFAMFLAFLLIAAQMAIALVEAFIIMSGGVLLLGFLGAPWTARFGMTYLTALIGTGVKVFMIFIVVGIGSSLVVTWSAAITAGLNYVQALTLIGVAAIFALATWMIPNYAQGLASGAVSTSLNTAVSSVAGIAASATGTRAPLAIAARGAAAVRQGAGLTVDRMRAGQGALRQNALLQ